MNEKATISIEAAAKRLGIGRSLAYELARTGALPGIIALGHRRLVSVVQLERYLNGGGVPEPAAEAVGNSSAQDSSPMPKCFHCHERADYIWRGFSACESCATLWWELEAKLDRPITMEFAAKALSGLEEDDIPDDLSLVTYASMIAAESDGGKVSSVPSVRSIGLIMQQQARERGVPV